MMISTFPKVMCTGHPEPKAWEFNGRSGVSYKVTISDGEGSLELPCASAEVWNVFKPFSYYAVQLETTQVANDNRLSTRSRVIGAKEV